MSEEFSWMDGKLEPSIVAADAPAKKRKRRPAELVRAERSLTLAQRVYLDLLVQCSTITDANRKMRDAGYSYDKGTYRRWRNNSQFAEALRLTKRYVLESIGISKESVLLDAEKVKQLALTEQPILHKGEDTGFREVNLGAALRALELQGKGVGLNDNEGSRVQVNIDIDFSGRQDEPQGVTIDGELG